MHLGTFEGERLRCSRGYDAPVSHARNVVALIAVAMFVLGLSLLERGL